MVNRMLDLLTSNFFILSQIAATPESVARSTFSYNVFKSIILANRRSVCPTLLLLFSLNFDLNETNTHNHMNSSQIADVKWTSNDTQVTRITIQFCRAVKYLFERQLTVKFRQQRAPTACHDTNVWRLMISFNSSTHGKVYIRRFELFDGNVNKNARRRRQGNNW